MQWTVSDALAEANSIRKLGRTNLHILLIRTWQAAQVPLGRKLWLHAS